MREKKRLIRKDRILEYIENLKRQFEDLKKLSVPDARFFTDRKNFERTKAIKYSLTCAIQDITRIALHIATALSLTRIKDSEADAIIALGDGGIIPREFADRIKGMPSFRNRIIHDYMPNEFDAERLYDALQKLDDFREFSRYIVEWLQKE